ncbi:pyridoxamine 5'-phosphate oxidase family protein [soil metagenome]
MTERTPIDVTNLDQYGNEALPWSGVIDALNTVFPDPPAPGQDYFTVLGTVLPDGRPHAASVGAMWIDGAWFVVSGPGTRKSRNLAGKPACTLTAKLPGIDVVFVGEAHRVTDAKTLERVAEFYRGVGWPVEVDGEAFTAPYTAPSGGPPPWNLYRIACNVAFGVGTVLDTSSGATKWTFDS